MTAAAQKELDPFWGWEEVALFCGAILPSIGGAMVMARLGGRIAPVALGSGAGRQLSFQFWVYAFLVSALFLIVSYRYKEPFWRSLGFQFPFRRAWLCLLVGPVLAVLTSALGAALRAPPVTSPIQGMITGRASFIAVVTFVSVLGPLVEEMVFRGFLLPVVRKSLGSIAAILITAAAFALLHGSQNQWSWQNLMIIGLAGVVFGVARLNLSSTLAAAVIHGAYNLTFFAGFVFVGK